MKDKNPSDKEGTTPLHTAAFKGHEKVFQFIFGEIQDKNPKDQDGWTPLHFAAAQGQNSNSVCS